MMRRHCTLKLDDVRGTSIRAAFARIIFLGIVVSWLSSDEILCIDLALLDELPIVWHGDGGRSVF